jgi:hypothetical protein
MLLKSMMVIFTALIFSTSALANSSQTQQFIPSGLNQECTELKNARNAKFCITETTASTNRDLVIFFHPRGTTEKNWISGSVGKNLRDHWKKKNLAPPVIATVSFGKFSILVRKNSKKRSGLLETFYSSVLPLIEHKVYQGKKALNKPSLLGFSMGGFNALQVYFHDQSYWKRIALINPAISSPDFTPFTSDKTLRKIAKKENISFMALYSAKIHGKVFFDNIKEWEASSPLSSARRSLTSKSPEILLNCGTRDHFGFYLGCKELKKISTTNSAPTTLKLKVNGSHSEFDHKTVGDFLVK